MKKKKSLWRKELLKQKLVALGFILGGIAVLFADAAGFSVVLWWIGLCVFFAREKVFLDRE